MSSLIAAFTVAGKAAGKTLAIKKNKEIVSLVSAVVTVFDRSGGVKTKAKPHK